VANLDNAAEFLTPLSDEYIKATFGNEADWKAQVSHDLSMPAPPPTLLTYRLLARIAQQRREIQILRSPRLL
jgi:hypothetical protein